MIERLCERCGQIYGPTRGGQKFCVSCRPAARLEATNRRNKAKVAARGKLSPNQSRPGCICGRCGVEFLRNNNRQVNCVECAGVVATEKRLRGARLRYQKRLSGPALSTCTACGAKEAFNSRKRFCRPCAKESRRSYLREHNQRRRPVLAEQARSRWATDPKHVLRMRISHSIRRSLSEPKRNRKWETLVGYDRDALITHMERQFPAGMGWHNMRAWHIDHIVPLASFDFSTADDQGFKAAWALTNLRPLWAAENVQKGAKRLHLI